MNKNIVIFGCDNAGKTTLAYEMQDLIYNFGYNVEYKHSLGKNATLDEMHDFMRENLMKDCVTIFDRFPVIEERVCGKVLRGKDAFEGFYGEYDAMLSKVDLFVFCMPHLFDVINWGGREQMEGVKDHAIELIKGYIDVAYALKREGRNIIQYSWRDELGTQGEFNKTVREVLR